jgi:hypothetical protein
LSPEVPDPRGDRSADDDSNRSSGAEVTAGGHELEVAQAYRSSALPLRRHQVGHPEEVGDVCGGWLFVDLGRAADLLDPAIRHHGQAVGHGERLLLIVGHIQECDPDRFLEGLELYLQGLSQLRVQGPQRLIKQEDRRVQDEARASHPLLLASRELVGKASQILQLYQGERPLNLHGLLRFRDPP